MAGAGVQPVLCFVIPCIAMWLASAVTVHYSKAIPKFAILKNTAQTGTALGLEFDSDFVIGTAFFGIAAS